MPTADHTANRASRGDLVDIGFEVGFRCGSVNDEAGDTGVTSCQHNKPRAVI
jgi:hypothetical protein